MNRFWLMSLVLISSGIIDVSHAAEPPVRSIDLQPGSAGAVIVEQLPLLHTTQILPWNEQGGLVPADQQVMRVFALLEQVLESGNSGANLLARLNVYATTHEVADSVQAKLNEMFAGPQRPAVTIVSTRLPFDAVVALDAIAVTSRPVEASVIQGKCSHWPIHVPGPHYSILPAGGRVDVAGQAEKGQDLAEATLKTLASLRSTLAHLQLEDQHVVQIKAFLTPMSDVATVQKVVREFYGEQVPSLVCVEWIAGAGSIEIELIAATGAGPVAAGVEYITPPGMTASPVFCRVTRTKSPQTIYLSGLYGQSDQPEEQVQQIFARLQKLLAETGSDLRHLVKATYYVSDNDVSAKLNELRPKYYDPQRPPSASKAVVAGVARDKRSITLDMIAIPKTATE